MYDEETKEGLNINWKSLLIKLGVVLIIAIIILLLISLFTKDKELKFKESNISVNLQAMKEAALDYFDETKLPVSINGKKKITLGEMFDNYLLAEFKDQNGNSCDEVSSYAEATKINSTDYTIKVKLVCGNESDYVISNKTIELKEEINNNVNNEVNNNVNNTNNNVTNNNSNNVVTKPSTNNSTTIKPSTSTTKPNTNTSASKPIVTVNTCKYGKKEYSTTYPLAYIVSGNCAVSSDVINYAEHYNTATDIGIKEYTKLNNEIRELENKTNTNLTVEMPVYTKVLNKTGTGYVGYQIMLVVKENSNYTSKDIYKYYLDSNGNRKVVLDYRNNLKNTSVVTSININQNDLELYVDDTKYLSATINPSNVTNKEISWSSSNNRIVKVNSNGKITALKEGKAYITATVDNVSDKILVYVYENETYTYCKRVEERIYSTGFAGKVDIENKNSLNYSYTLDFERKNIDDLEVVDYGNLNNTLSEYKKAYNYLVSYRKPIEIVNNDSGVDPLSGKNLMETSLKSNNMTPYVSYLYNRGNSYYFNVNIRLYNLYNVRDAYKHYTSEDYWVYFVPLYFDVEYTDLNDCERVNAKDEYSYKNNNYVKVR